MRVRAERLRKLNSQRTYRAIEAENHRACEPRLSKSSGNVATLEPNDQRSPAEIARAINAALRGAA